MDEFACVFCNGVLGNPKAATEIARNAGLLLAANGGSANLLRLGIEPHAVIGDMDSLPPGIWPGTLRFEYPEEKDRTDAELAVEYALKEGYEKVWMIAATGGRLEHTLGNIAIVARYPGKVFLLDGDSVVCAVAANQEYAPVTKIGSVVSVIPVGSDVPVVTTSGLKYLLNGQPLIHATHGVSNVALAEKVRIQVKEGCVLICH
ncbi:MAG: thiamine diphosphokinase [Verrucomicrobiota bacterium]